MLISKTKDPKLAESYKKQHIFPDRGEQPKCDQHRNFTGSKRCVTVVSDAVLLEVGHNTISVLGKK